MFSLHYLNNQILPKDTKNTLFRAKVSINEYLIIVLPKTKADIYSTQQKLRRMVYSMNIISRFDSRFEEIIIILEFKVVWNLWSRIENTVLSEYVIKQKF